MPRGGSKRILMLYPGPIQTILRNHSKKYTNAWGRGFPCKKDRGASLNF